MGWDYMRELAKQEPIVLRDLRLAAEWVARGKNPVVIAPKRETIVEFQKAGAPIKFVTNLEGNYLVGGAGTVSLLNTPAHPNATKIFVNWLLSKEGQTAYSLAASTQSARLDVPVDHLDPVWRRDPSINYFVTEDEDFLLHQEEQLKLAKEIFGPLIK